MPYRELTEWPMSLRERSVLAWLVRGLQGEHPNLCADSRRVVEKIYDVRISTHERRASAESYHEAVFFRDGVKAYGLGWKLPDPEAEHLTRVGRRNLSAFQKGWCAAEREASRAV